MDPAALGVARGIPLVLLGARVAVSVFGGDTEGVSALPVLTFLAAAGVLDLR